MTGKRESFRAPGYAERRPGKSPTQLRADWVEAVALGITVTGHAAAADRGEHPAEAGQTLTRLAAKLRDLTPENFPAPTHAARVIAGAFLLVARAIVDARCGPTTRTACAPLLTSASMGLSSALAELRTAEAGRWQGQFERDGG